MAEVLDRHPRQDFARLLRTYWAAECEVVPAGRARWLTRTAGFPLLVRLAPFDE